MLRAYQLPRLNYPVGGRHLTELSGNYLRAVHKDADLSFKLSDGLCTLCKDCKEEGKLHRKKIYIKEKRKKRRRWGGVGNLFEIDEGLFEKFGMKINVMGENTLRRCYTN